MSNVVTKKDNKNNVYAITMWHEHHESQRTKDFLIEIARKLYTKSMAHVEIKLDF